MLTLNPNAFVHKTTGKKLELVILMELETVPLVRREIQKLEQVLPKNLSVAERASLLPLLAVLKKDSCDKFTEIEKRLVRYNRRHYLVRTYKMVDESRFYKLEITACAKPKQAKLETDSIFKQGRLMNKVIKSVVSKTVPMYFHHDLNSVTTVSQFLAEINRLKLPLQPL